MRHQQGIIALLTVLITTAVFSLIIMSASLLGVSEAQLGIRAGESARASYLSFACAEQALLELKQSFDTEISGNLVLGGVSCTYTITGSDPSSIRTIVSTSNVSGFLKQLSITVTETNGALRIISWREF